ncbi:MAG TPA: phosphoglycerate kinase [Candidatus Onthovivens sp.]|nr:phosphoglycerate kinase [Candidatus Onthovivens sp.]
MNTIDTLKDLDNKKVLVRVDFNVPLKGSEVRDDNRVQAALPTIKALLEKGATLVLMSHLGKIKWGKVSDEEIEAQKKKNNMEYVLPVLEKHLPGVKVYFSKATSGEELAAAIAKLNKGEVLLVQNTRYEKGESKNSPELAADWAKNVDGFVMDAFGSAHRAHASTFGVPSILKAEGKMVALGYLMEKEVKNLGACVEGKTHPYIAILGGFKVSDKIKVISALLNKCDKILIGGAMAFTFAKALGISIGNSPCEDDQLEFARKCYSSGKIVLPIDSKCANGFDNYNDIITVNTEVELGKAGIPDGYQGLDIGPKTAKLYEDIIRSSRLIFWNGPMGVFEDPNFQDGTKAVCKAISLNKDAFSVIGGGDSAAAAKEFGYSEGFSHVSTGGGASLEMIENDGALPGIDVIG